MTTPGFYYEPSGKFDLKRVILFTLIGIIPAVIIGVVYAALVSINPFIYLNMLVLMGAVVLTTVMSSLVWQGSHSRNKTVNVLVGIFLVYTAWASNWAFIGSGHYSHHSFWATIYNPNAIMQIISERAGGRTMSIGRFGSRGIPFHGDALAFFYFVEFAAFFLPLFFAKHETYYCENCQSYFLEKGAYIEDIDNFYTLRVQAGEEEEPTYRFLQELRFTRHPDVEKGGQRDLVKVTLHRCHKCDDSLIDVASCTATNEKGTINYKGEDHMTKGMYLGKDVSEMLLRKL
jgi:hypothetical protein